MKTFRFFIIIALFCSGATTSILNAQADVTVSPVALLFGNPNVGVDFKVKENFSLGATGSYSRGNLWGLVDSRETVTANLVGKYYFSPKHGADGFYADAFSRFVNRSIAATYNGGDEEVPTTVNFTRTQVGLGFGIGYKVVSQKGFTFDIGTGIGRALYSHDSLNVSEQDYKFPELVNSMGYFRIGIGYRFGNKEDY